MRFSDSIIVLRHSRAFEWVTVAVIIAAAVGVGLKTYDIPPSVAAFLHGADLAVTVFFLVEILVRMAAEPRLRDFFKGGWNWFDLTIVVASLIPVGEADSVLVARLLRIFRVMRLVVVVPQLRSLVSSLLLALPRMGYVLLMMFVIFYIYGAMGALFFAHINAALWGDVGAAMLTLFRVATLEDWTDVMYETMAVYPVSWIYYLSFIFFAAFVFLNMMIGAIVSVMHEEHTAQAPPSRTEARILSEIAELRAELKQLRPPPRE